MTNHMTSKDHHKNKIITAMNIKILTHLLSLTLAKNAFKETKRLCLNEDDAQFRLTGKNSHNKASSNSVIGSEG